MTQIEFVRAEVEKLKGELPKQRGYKRNAYNHVLRIIDSAPKELPMDKLDELKRAWYQEGFINGKYEGLSDDKKYQQGLHDAKEQMMKDAIEGEVIDKGDFIKFANGKYIDLDPTMGAEPFVKLEEGDKVKVIIIKE